MMHVDIRTVGQPVIAENQEALAILAQHETRRRVRIYPAMPQIGQRVAFATGVLTGIPAHVAAVLAHLRDGSHLVSLEYATPVRFNNTLITRIDACTADLRPV